jgi:hypothetical protein
LNKYNIVNYPASIIYIADFHQMKCLSPSGNHAHLYYREADTTDSANTITEAKLCMRLNINGWEIIDATDANQVKIIGESRNYAKTALTYFVDLENVSCWKDAIGNANLGVSLGNFEPSVGMCISNKLTTAYIGYNTPTFANIDKYLTSPKEMLYFLTEKKDRCVT